MKWSIDCPHCGHKHENWQDYIDTGDMEGEFPMICENETCGKEFQVKYSTEITFKVSK